MKYNTQLEKMRIPEYGRNVQNMVKYAMTLEDRAERTRCANSIINIMGNLFPYLRDNDDFKHKLWDHIAVMSDFNLDIDYPYQIIKKEELNTAPNEVDRCVKRGDLRFRHYGRILEKMIQKASQLESPTQRKQLILMIAHHMKRSYMNSFKESKENRDFEISDDKIFSDIVDYSNGVLADDIHSLSLRASNRENNIQRKHKHVIKRAVR